MREPPPISEESICACLRERYGLRDAALALVRGGADVSAWGYRVERAGGPPLFLKLRRGALNMPSLDVPFFLRGLGVEAAVAPLAGLDGALWAGLGDYALALYPFVAGRMGADGGLSDAQWRALGAAARAMHDAAVPAGLADALRRERWEPDFLADLREVGRRVAAGELRDDLGRELAAVWRANEGRIAAVSEQAEALGGVLRGRGLPHVLCHADLHTWNVLAGNAGELWIVDWDEVTLAPRERDLMFIVGGIGAGLVGERGERMFFEGYGPYALDREALRYYRCAWATQDIGSYAAQVAVWPGQSEADRRWALELLAEQFAAGGMVEIALG